MRPAELRLVLVEDNDVDREAVRRLLPSKWELTEATNLAEGLRALDSGEHDCVLLDLGLPDAGDTEALERVRAGHPQLAVIVLTGINDDALGERLIEAGAADYLPKEELGRAVLTRSVRHSIARCEEQARRERYEAELRQKEAQLHRSQQMELVGRLAGGVAHDFNNLLCVILSSVEFLRSDLGDDAPALEDLGHIEEAARRASALTGRMLAFTRQDAADSRVFDLRDALSDLTRMASSLIGEDVELAVELPSEPLCVEMDPVHFEQIVLNLVINARDAMPKGGRLGLKLQRVERGAARAGVTDAADGYALLAVTDTGVGMDDALLAKIFEPFFTTKDVGRGTGLGLATVRAITEGAGGTVQADSQPGRGTTFRVHLPSTEQPESATGSQSLRPAPPGEESILLVEDDALVRRAAARSLRAAGYRVHVADTPGTALLIAEQHGPEIDLVLTDVVMPLLSGPELVARLRPIIPQARVLFASGYTAPEVDLPAGVPLLKKPFSPASIATAVREALDAAPPADVVAS